jgi:hypothetical protein
LFFVRRAIGALGVVMNSVWESFLCAAQALSSAGPIKRRLVTAYGAHLSSLHSEELPREIREEFQALGVGLSSVRPLRGETALQASVRKMSDQEAAGYALRIVNLLGAMARLQLHARPALLRAVNSGDD